MPYFNNLQRKRFYLLEKIITNPGNSPIHPISKIFSVIDIFHILNNIPPEAVQKRI